MDLNGCAFHEQDVISLKQSATSGIKWSAVSQVGRQVMQVATLMILARLLAPTDFGLIGMATIVIGFIDAFNDLGTSAAVIQRRNLSEELLSSIFWVNLAIGLLATTLFLVLSPLVANLYREPEVGRILRGLSFTCLISGPGILQRALLERELAFKRLAKVELSATVCGSIIGITAALLGAGVWSLVYLSLTAGTVTTVMLWTSSGWRPRMTFRWVEVKSVSSYGLNLTGVKIINYFARNADYLLIGRFLGAQALGYYSMAYRIMLFPLENISGVIGRVMFPVYSQFADDDARFRLAYLKVAGTIALMAFPMMIGLMALSEPFVLSTFGSHWMPVSVLLTILAPVGMVQSIGTTVAAIYQVKARTDWMLWWGMCMGLFLVFAFVVGLQWGIVGVSSAYAVAYGIVVYPHFAIPFRLIKLRFRDLAGTLWRPFAASLVMCGMITVVRFVLPPNLSSASILGILVPTGCLIYLFVSWLINRSQLREVMRMSGVRG